MDTLLKRLNSDEVLFRHGRYYTTQINIISGAEEYRFDINKGQVSKGKTNDSATHGFSLIASPESWGKFCQQIPPPEYHELGALLASGHLQRQGDIQAMESNFMYVRRLLEIWREDQRERVQ